MYMKNGLKIKIPPYLEALSQALLPYSAYIVGGFVRNFVLGVHGGDIDLCGNAPVDTVVESAAAVGFTAEAVYKRTSTVKLRHTVTGQDCEYTRLRIDSYPKGGNHTPLGVKFTDCIKEDARRRDFTFNALYCRLSDGQVYDPLNALRDIAHKRIRACAEDTFCFDGLRLMRLVRFAAETGFYIEPQTLKSAIKNADCIADISAERIYAELSLILTADTKYPQLTAPRPAHFRGLQLMLQAGLMQRILPEVQDCKGIPQPAQHHMYDVLMHTLMTVRYADADIRLAALLHDIGKAATYGRSGGFLGHAKDSAELAANILKRLRVPQKLQRQTLFLIENHMYDGGGNTSEGKMRLFIALNRQYIDKLVRLIYADRRATAAGVVGAEKARVRWDEIIRRMESQNAPASLKQLCVRGDDIITLGARGSEISQVLRHLLKICVVKPQLNNREMLLTHAKSYLGNIRACDV